MKDAINQRHRKKPQNVAAAPAMETALRKSRLAQMSISSPTLCPPLASGPQSDVSLCYLKAFLHVSELALYSSSWITIHFISPSVCAYYVLGTLYVLGRRVPFGIWASYFGREK